MNLTTLWNILASQYPTWLNSVWLNRVAVVVTAGLVVLIAQAAAQLTWQFIPAPTLPDATSTAMQQDTDRQTQRLASDYAMIASWPLFGAAPIAKAPPPPPPPPPVMQQRPETPLNLRLVGIFYSTTGRFTPRALIAEGNNPEKNYTVGAELPGGARLEQVMPEEVVLSRAGRLERLLLPKEESTSNRPFGAGGLDFLPQPSAEMPPMEGQPEMPLTEPQSLAPIDNSAVIGQLRKEALERPSSLQDLAFVSPYMQNGQFMGFRLRPGRNRQLLGQLGLQAGDVVTQVNGMRLESPTQGLTALQDLMSADQVTLQVLRDGAEFPMSFSLNSQ